MSLLNRHFMHKIIPKISPLNLSKSSFFRFQTKRFIHQDFYHPYDVPMYQTPTLGEGDFKGNEITEIINPTQNYIIRNKYIDWDYKFKGQDYPSFINRQDPELFLPEEPTFLEFWGFYPFLFFTGAFALSHEYYNGIFYLSEQASIIMIGPMLFTFMALTQFAAKKIAEDDQFLEDRDWINMATYKHFQDKKIDEIENQIKSKIYAKDFDAYKQRLNNMKVAYFAYEREKIFTKNIINAMSNIQRCSSNYKSFMKTEIIENMMKHVEKTKKDEKFLDTIQKMSFDTLKEEMEGEEIDYFNYFRDENCNPVFDKYYDHLNGKYKEIMDNLDKRQKSDVSARVLMKTLFKNLKNLKVYDGPKEFDGTFVPRETGLYGEVKMSENEKQVHKEKLKKAKLRVLKEQMNKFLPGREPTLLLEKYKKVCEE